MQPYYGAKNDRRNFCLETATEVTGLFACKLLLLCHVQGGIVNAALRLRQT